MAFRTAIASSRSGVPPCRGNDQADDSHLRRPRGGSELELVKTEGLLKTMIPRYREDRPETIIDQDDIRITLMCILQSLFNATLA